MITWVSEMRYLGVFLVKSRSFKICLDYAKCSFYRAANAIFSKIWRLASEQVTLQLIVVSKCMPMLLYDLQPCTLNKSQLSSRDFTINRFFYEIVSAMKLCEHVKRISTLSFPVFCIRKERKN